MFEHLDPNLTQLQILNNPLLNKGTAFTQEERDAFHLNGFLPHHISTIEEQVVRRYANFQGKKNELSKYIFLANLQDRNETLFYRLVQEHIEEMLPLIYTPTVGDVSVVFSSLYRQHRGIYFSYPMKDRIKEIVAQIPRAEIDVIVVTDGERILGLGDVGVGGMAIPQGKLALYTLFGGIHPARTLPIMLDVGTNNPELLADPLYLGWHHTRVDGEEYYAFIDAFVQAIRERYPRVLLQWEDFANRHAKPLLEKYQDQICSFNDDIQGTASVVLAGLLSAVKLKGESLKDQTVALFGCGSAGLGIANLIVQAMMLEGLTEAQARQRFYCVDKDGLIHTQIAGPSEGQKIFARRYEELSGWKLKGEGSGITLLDVMSNAKPTLLIGVSAQPGSFTEEIVHTMAQHTPRPIIFPLSNPNSRCEAKPDDLIRWTRGQAIIATGSPFAPVIHQSQAYHTSQCNNVFIFPGLGLGVVAVGSRRVNHRMCMRAAEVLSAHAPALRDGTTALFPSLENLRSVSRSIAIAVGEVAQAEGFCPKISREELKRRVDATMWKPEYPIYCKKT